MLKFKNKEGKTMGVLKDDASEPEGEMMLKDTHRGQEEPDEEEEMEEQDAE